MQWRWRSPAFCTRARGAATSSPPWACRTGAHYYPPLHPAVHSYCTSLRASTPPPAPTLGAGRYWCAALAVGHLHGTGKQGCGSQRRGRMRSGRLPWKAATCWGKQTTTRRVSQRTLLPARRGIADAPTRASGSHTGRPPCTNLCVCAARARAARHVQAAVLQQASAPRNASSANARARLFDVCGRWGKGTTQAKSRSTRSCFRVGWHVRSLATHTH